MDRSQMIISEKQILALFQILRDSFLSMDMGKCSISFESRSTLYNTILNQQSEKLIEVKDDN